MEEKETVEQPTNTENTDTQTAEKKEEKTFTQEEVNAMIEARLKRATKNVLPKEEIEKYNQWKESQKTEEDKRNELTQENLTYKNENTELKQLLTIMEKGISKDEAEFIQFKLNKMEGDFEENLDDYLEKNPKFLQKEEKPNTKTDGLSVNKKTTSQLDGVTAILKAKYPDRF